VAVADVMDGSIDVGVYAAWNAAKLSSAGRRFVDVLESDPWSQRPI